MNGQYANGVLRLARWLPAVACLPLMAESAVMYAWGQSGWPSLVVTLLMTLACLGVALRSDLAWLVVFLWLVLQILPFPVMTTSVVPPLLATLLILGCIGAVQGVLAALIALTGYLPALSRGGTTHMPIDAIFIQFGFFMLAVGAGIVWGSYQRRTRRERRRASQTYQRNALRVADRLHNSVANDLVYLDRVLAGDKLTSDQIEQARNVLSSALGKVHQVIDELAVSTPGNADTSSDSHQEERLPRLFSSWDRKLAQAGFTGGSLLDEHTDLAWMGRQAAESLTGMIDEIYGNILKHADPGDGYCVSLTDDGGRLVISVADSPADMPRHDGHEGTGITRCRRWAAQLRGNLDVSQDDHQWTMTITIPHPDALADHLPQEHHGQWIRPLQVTTRDCEAPPQAKDEASETVPAEGGATTAALTNSPATTRATLAMAIPSNQIPLLPPEL